MNIVSRQFLRILLVLLALVLILLPGGCDKDQRSPTASTQDKPFVIPGLPPDPGAGNLTGKVIGTIMKQPLAGVTVSIGSQAAITNPNGEFYLDGVGSGRLSLTLSGREIYPRTTVVETSSSRSVQLDVIEKASEFNLGFYRELARGNHPEEKQMLALQRWTVAAAPTFYIDTNADAIKAETIPRATIELTRQIIAQVLPVFSGNRYTTPVVMERRFSQHDFESIPENSIVISFDDTLYLKGALGVTFTEPDFSSVRYHSLQKAWIFVLNQEALYQAGGISKKEIIAHELGHSFGYRHTSLLPSVMVKAGSYGNLFSPYDKFHMAIVYNRAAGNTDIDNDPLSDQTLQRSKIMRRVFVDRRENLPQSLSLRQDLETLSHFTDEFFQTQAIAAGGYIMVE